MTWRDLAWGSLDHPGLRAGAAHGAAAGLIVTGAIWWFGAPHDHAGPRGDGPVFLSPGTPRRSSSGSRPDRSRAETVDHSAAELRRIERDLHDGAQARLVALSDDARAWPTSCSPGPRGGAQAGQPRPATPPARRSATCAPWSAASTRRCSRTAGWPARCEALALDMAIPVDGDAERSAGGRRRPSSPRSTSRWPSAWPTSASTPGRARLGRAGPRGRACCAWRGGRRRGRRRRRHRHRHARGDATAGGIDGTMSGVEPRRGPDAGHPGGPVRLVVAEDNALLRDGLIRLLEANGFTVVARRRQRPGARAGAARPGRRRRRGRRTHAADVHRRGPARRDRGPRGPARASRCWCSRSTSSSSTPASCWPAARARSATCSRTGSPTSREFVDAVRRVAAGGTVLDPEVVAAIMARRRDEPRRPAHAARAGGARADGRGPVERRDRRAPWSSPRRPSPSTPTASSPSSTCRSRADDNRRVLAVLAWLR